MKIANHVFEEVSAGGLLEILCSNVSHLVGCVNHPWLRVFVEIGFMGEVDI